MPQPIEEGMVLGGRYLITGHVLTSADQDMVLDGRDQVLNRDVSILVASADHASQVAASARELATGERQGGIQVLDLGLSEGRTYLIAGGNPGPDDLLDMTREQQVYVEPFQTDTLGSEIFGEARTYEPHVYEDDEEYYEDLDDSFAVESPERRRPRFLKGISERLSERLGSHDAAKDAVSGAGSTGAAGAAAAEIPEGHDDGQSAGHGEATGSDPYRSAIRRKDEKPIPDTVSDDEWTGTHEVAVAPGPAPDAAPGAATAGVADTGKVRRTDVAGGATSGAAASAEKVRGADVVGGAGAAAGATAAADAGTGPGTAAAGPGVAAGADAARSKGADAPSEPDTGAEPGNHSGATPERKDREEVDVAPRRPKVSLWSDAEDDDQNGRQDRSAGSAAPAAGLAAGAATAATAAVAGDRRDASHDPGPTGAGADPDHGGPGHDGDYDAFADEYEDEDYQDEDKPGGARWILGGILALVLILGAVFAFNLLGNNRDPQAGNEDNTTSSPAAESATGQNGGSNLPEPVIAGATRLVPDSPQLSAETDNTLPNAIDGNPATAWQTYSFAQPAFGGYANSMALVVELEEPSAISQVDIAQSNGSGGSFTVLLNDAPELDGARQIAEGSFTGPQVSVPVSGENGAPAEAQYVIINFTELPQLSNASGSLPYGLRIAEVQVQ